MMGLSYHMRTPGHQQLDISGPGARGSKDQQLGPGLCSNQLRDARGGTYTRPPSSIKTPDPEQRRDSSDFLSLCLSTPSVSLYLQ